LWSFQVQPPVFKSGLVSYCRDGKFLSHNLGSDFTLLLLLPLPLFPLLLLPLFLESLVMVLLLLVELVKAQVLLLLVELVKAQVVLLQFH